MAAWPRCKAAGRMPTMLTSPAYFRLEEAGYKTLANLAEHEDIFASTTYLMKKSQVTADPGLPVKFHQSSCRSHQALL